MIASRKLKKYATWRKRYEQSEQTPRHAARYGRWPWHLGRYNWWPLHLWDAVYWPLFCRRVSVTDCKECDGTGSVWRMGFDRSPDGGRSEPCAYCQDEDDYNWREMENEK